MNTWQKIRTRWLKALIAYHRRQAHGRPVSLLQARRLRVWMRNMACATHESHA